MNPFVVGVALVVVVAGVVVYTKKK